MAFGGREFSIPGAQTGFARAAQRRMQTGRLSPKPDLNVPEAQQVAQPMPAGLERFGGVPPAFGLGDLRAQMAQPTPAGFQGQIAQMLQAQQQPAGGGFMPQANPAEQFGGLQSSFAPEVQPQIELQRAVQAKLAEQANRRLMPFAQRGGF